jgi:regulator of replication initiation timing
MKKVYRTLMLVVLAALVFGGMLWARDRDRDRAVRGTFVRLIERSVGDRGYMGIVVKPFESDEHVTVLVPREREELWQAARRLQDGQRVGISFVTEAGHQWIKGMEAERRREQIEEGPEGRGTRTVRREVRRGPREAERRPEGERGPGGRREVQRGREPDREGRRPGRELPHLEQLEGQLKEVVTWNLERMSAALKEVLAVHLERMEAETRELRAHVGKMQRELDGLRAENERLRRQLRERGGPGREGDREVRDRREAERRMEGRERDERRDGREQEERDVRREGGEREERVIRRDRDRDERPEPGEL